MFKRAVVWAGQTERRAQVVAGVVVGVVLLAGVAGMVALSLAVGFGKAAALYTSVAVAASNQARKAREEKSPKRLAGGGRR